LPCTVVGLSRLSARPSVCPTAACVCPDFGQATDSVGNALWGANPTKPKPFSSHNPGIRAQVMHAISCAEIVSIAIDGWEDYAKFLTLAHTITLPMGRNFLWSMERVLERETSEFMAK